jgi:hypothetical protein
MNLTRSRGYVVPGQKDILTNAYGRGVRVYSLTDVIPARAPASNRVGVSSCRAPFPVKNYTKSEGESIIETVKYLLSSISRMC